MNIIIEDIDLLIIDKCNSLNDFNLIMRINSKFNSLILINQLFIEWKILHIKFGGEKKLFAHGLEYGYFRVCKHFWYEENLNILEPTQILKNICKAPYSVHICKQFINFLSDQKIGPIDIHADNESIFIDVCAYGRIGIAKWLIKLGHDPKFGMINIHACTKREFKFICRRSIIIANWLISLGLNYRIKPRYFQDRYHG